jgi:hypothetical protein
MASLTRGNAVGRNSAYGRARHVPAEVASDLPAGGFPNSNPAASRNRHAGEWQPPLT